MRILRFEVAYDGTDFHGWQVQPGLPTVQGILQDVIGTIEEKPVQVLGSGRTDAGVHALAQVAAVALDNPIPPDNFRRAVNRLLPSSVRISKISETNPDFHPRFHARRKTYQYRIYRDEVCSPFLRHFVYHLPYPLNEAAIAEAAPLLEGEHDFTSFAACDKTDAVAGSRRRTIFGSACAREENILAYTVTGSGFLKHMVRNIVGVLLEVGKGNLSQADLLARLKPASGILPGPAVPACGLFLVSVDYDGPKNEFVR